MNGLRIALEALIVFLQGVLLMYAHDIRGTIQDHDDRLLVVEAIAAVGVEAHAMQEKQNDRLNDLETFAGQGGRWSIEQQIEHERVMEARIAKLWRAIDNRDGGGGTTR